MELSDERGRSLSEVTVRLSENEVIDLLVAASQLEEGDEDHVLVPSAEGAVLALYRQTGEGSPLARNTDWWVGPLILVAVLFVVVGAYTIARGILGLLF